MLADGTRVIEADALEKLFAAMADPATRAAVDLVELQRLSEWQRGN